MAVIMKNEDYRNKIVKGIWSLTGLKSSEYIRMIKNKYPETTGSRLRGIMSSATNKNYRKANVNDVLQSLFTVNEWANGSDLVDDISNLDLMELLKHVNFAKDKCSEKDEESRRKEFFRAVLTEII